MGAICDASSVYLLKQHMSRFPANIFRDHGSLSLQYSMQASVHVDKQNWDPGPQALEGSQHVTAISSV